MFEDSRRSEMARSHMQLRVLISFLCLNFYFGVSHADTGKNLWNWNYQNLTTLETNEVSTASQSEAEEENSVTAADSEDFVATSTSKQPLINWNSADLPKPIISTGSQSTTSGTRAPIPPVPKGSCCANGWIHYEDSCYLLQQTKNTMAAQEQFCYENNATMFVANTIDEWNTIRRMAPLASFSWIGLIRFKDGEKNPTWQTADGMDTSLMKWTIKNGSPFANGWTTVSQCVGSWNGIRDVVSYVRYFPCNNRYYTICERNATLINEMWEQSQATTTSSTIDGSGEGSGIEGSGVDN